jgi:hypothetical protein
VNIKMPQISSCNHFEELSPAHHWGSFKQKQEQQQRGYDGAGATLAANQAAARTAGAKQSPPSKAHADTLHFISHFPLPIAPSTHKYLSKLSCVEVNQNAVSHVPLVAVRHALSTVLRRSGLVGSTTVVVKVRSSANINNSEQRGTPG